MSALPINHLCAHRGYHNAHSDDDPDRPLENTLPAYQQSFDHLRFAECDVQVTRDMTVVLAHDITLARVADLSSDTQPPPWPEGILQLFEPVAAWHSLPASKRTSVSTKIPDAHRSNFEALLEAAPLLSRASEQAAANLEGWVKEQSISEKARELLTCLAPIERESLTTAPADGPREALIVTYLAHRAVADLTFDQLVRVPLKGGERVAPLKAVLDTLSAHPAGDRHLVIEVKPGSPEVVGPLCDLLEEHSIATQATIMSFDLDIIDAVSKRVGRASGEDPAHRCLWLACTRSWDEDAHGFTYAQVSKEPASLERVLSIIEEANLDGIYIEYNSEIVSAAVLADLRARGLFVGIWSSNPEHDTPGVVATLISQGVDLINTDEAITLPKALATLKS